MAARQVSTGLNNRAERRVCAADKWVGRVRGGAQISRI
jgi:hypothetical protein